MFEVGQRVVCVKPAESEWFPGIPPELAPKHVPVTGGIYTIREIVTGSHEPDGPHWTKSPGLVGLIFHEIRNPKRLTTNGPDQEQAFHEDDFMPLNEREQGAESAQEKAEPTVLPQKEAAR